LITINITVSDCRATLQGTPTIVCGNKEKYSVKFAFDSEWGADTAKTARFVWVAGGKLRHTDVIFTGDTVEVPQLVGTNEVKVGVFEGDLQTTTPARIYCEKSIRCYGGEPAEETPGQYDHIMTLYNQALEQQAAAESAANTARVAAQAATASQSKVEAIVAGNEAYTKNEADSRAAPAIVQSVSGAAVAVHDAAARPLQALVLHGGATQAGTPTPDAPLELVPAVNAGPVNVTVCGKNMLPYPYDEATLTRAGVKFTVNEDGTIKASGTSTGAYILLIKKETERLYLHAGKTYTFKAMPAGADLTTYYAYVAIGEETFFDTGSGVTLTPAVSGYAAVTAVVKDGQTVNGLTIRPQLEIGSTASSFEPYQGQVLTIDVPAMYAGSLDVLTGRALYAGISEPQASGWNTGRSASGWAHGYDSIGKDTIPMNFHLGGEKADYFPATLCSHFPAAASWADIVGGITEMAYRGNSGGGLAYVAVRIKRSRLAEYGFVDDGTGDTAPAAFQAWLEAQAAAGTPVQFVGEIDNTAELGVKSAQSYKLTTTVTNDAGAAMSVAYVADTAAYIAANGGSRPVSSNSVLLKDHETGTVYELYVSGGKLRMAAVN
jgi:hypothetical protein